MDTPNWRQVVGGAVGITLLGTIGFFGQARIRTNATPQQFVSSKSKTSINSIPARSAENNSNLPTDGDFNMPTPAVKIKVDIAGEIEKPGVYEIPEGLRVEDLVKLAGGLKPHADRIKLNMSLMLKDGSKVIVYESKVRKPRQSSSKGKSASQEPVYKVSKSTLKAVNPRYKPKSKSSKNTRNEAQHVGLGTDSATATYLYAVPDIGPYKSKRMVDFRSSIGSFRR